MANFTRQNVGLNVAFPPSGLGKHEPSRLEEVVSLTHPFLGPLTRFRDMEVQTAVSAAAAVFVDSDEAPLTEVHYIQALNVSQTDAAQALSIVAFNAVLGSAILLRTTTELPPALWPGAGTPFGLDRPFLLAPGYRIRCSRATGGAGTITLQLQRVRFSLAEEPPAI